MVEQSGEMSGTLIPSASPNRKPVPPQSAKKTRYFSFLAAAVQQKSTLDGFGRAIKTSILDATNNSYSIIETQFDPLNRPYKVSNPHNSTAQYWTESDFDALGRPTVVIPPDGTSTANNTKYTYTTNSVIVTDPSGKARKQQIDGLGRTVKSLEPDVTNGNSLTQDTEMTYSVLDRLMSTTQGSQIRTYGYDDLGRLLSVKTPEANQVVTSYTYNNFDLMTQRTDARGVKTSYTYDLLNRPYQMLYDVGATGVPADQPEFLYHGERESLHHNLIG
jgi:YD repeat-containing protein